MTARYNATWAVIVERARETLRSRWRPHQKKCGYCSTGDDYLHAFTCPVPGARHVLDMQAWIERCEAKLREKGVEGEAEQKVWRSEFCRMQTGKLDR